VELCNWAGGDISSDELPARQGQVLCLGADINGDIVNNNDVQKSKPIGTYECSQVCTTLAYWFAGVFSARGSPCSGGCPLASTRPKKT